MLNSEDWNANAKGLLKSELARRNVGLGELVELLGRLGVAETPENLSNKINRGKFSAAFMLQCMRAINCKMVRLSDD